MDTYTSVIPYTLLASTPVTATSPFLFFASSEETPSPEEDLEKGEERREESTDDAVWLYLRDIGQFPLLTLEQEQHLTCAMALAHAERRRPADQQRHNILREGDAAMERLVNANLRLVVSIARRYRPRTMSMLDLIQEGNLGLMQAAERFDVSRGHRFSTYATWWIRQAILRALTNQDRLIRLPSYQVEMVRRVTRTGEQLTQELGREPGVEELAVAMGVSSGKVREWEMTVDPISLHVSVGEADDDAELGDFLAAPDEDPADQAIDHLMHEQLIQALVILSPREYTILAFHYGLHDGRSHTFEEIGARFHLTRQ